MGVGANIDISVAKCKLITRPYLEKMNGQTEKQSRMIKAAMTYADKMEASLYECIVPGPSIS